LQREPGFAHGAVCADSEMAAQFKPMPASGPPVVGVDREPWGWRGDVGLRAAVAAFAINVGAIPFGLADATFFKGNL